jgi:hypothetical protein
MYMQRKIIVLSILLALVGASTQALSASVTGLTTFSAGTPAKADEVNANFTAVKTAVDDNDSRITALQADNQALHAENEALKARLADIETKLSHVTLETINGQPTVRFSGVNVQVVNGMGNSDSANGTGNLIVGYDEADTSGVSRCTLGTNPGTGAAVIDQASCVTAGGEWVSTGFKSGSHYLVMGSQNNYSRWGGLVAGYQNTANYDYATVVGGVLNVASGKYASVSGGGTNTASGSAASISGGYNNGATADNATISGGSGNRADGVFASVSGGSANTASGSNTSVSGGVGCAVTSTNLYPAKWAIGIADIFGNNGLGAGCSSTLAN